MLLLRNYIHTTATILLVVSTTCLCRPHGRNKRFIVKDYFIDPINIPPSIEFEKDAEGKYHLKKADHARAESLDAKDDAIKMKAKVAESSIAKAVQNADEIKPVLLDSSKKVEPKEIGKEMLLDNEKSPKGKVDETKTEKIDDEIGKKTFKEADIPRIFDETLKKESKKVDEKIVESMKPTLPEIPKVMEKPNSKDDNILHEDLDSSYDYENSKAKEEDMKRVIIGQIPGLYPPPMPILVPVRGLSYGSVSFMPLPPPAMDVSDRLPMLDVEADVDDSETSMVEDVAPEPHAIKKSEVSYNLGNPLALAMELPFLPLHSMLSEVESILSKTDVSGPEGDKPQNETKSEIKEIMGRKFLLKTNVMKYPNNGNNRMHVRLISVQPIEKVDPEIIKELTKDKDVDDGISKKADEDLKDKKVDEDFNKHELSNKRVSESESVAKMDDTVLKEIAKMDEESDMTSSEISDKIEASKTVDILKSEKDSKKVESDLKLNMFDKSQKEFKSGFEDKEMIKSPKAVESTMKEIDLKENAMFPANFETEMRARDEVKLEEKVMVEAEIKNNDGKIDSGEIVEKSEMKLKTDEERKKMNEDEMVKKDEILKDEYLEIRGPFNDFIEDRLPIDDYDSKIILVEKEVFKKDDKSVEDTAKDMTEKNIFSKTLNEEPSEFVEKKVKPEMDMGLTKKIKEVDESEEETQDSSILKKTIVEEADVASTIKKENEKMDKKEISDKSLVKKINKDESLHLEGEMIYFENKKKIDENEGIQQSKTRIQKKKKCKCEDSDSDSEED